MCNSLEDKQSKGLDIGQVNLRNGLDVEAGCGTVQTVRRWIVLLMRDGNEKWNPDQEVEM